MKNILLLIISVISLNAYSQNLKGVQVNDAETGFDKRLEWIENCDKFYEMHTGIDKDKVKCVNLEQIDYIKCKVQNGTINTSNCKEASCESCSCEGLAAAAARSGYILTTCVEDEHGGASGELTKFILKKAMVIKNEKGIIKRN